MATPTIYTGSGLAARLPEDSGRPMSRLSDFIRQTEEFKYKAYKENEQEFLKNVNVDPVHFISTANQTAQLKALEVHNKEWSQKWQQTNGNLSTEDKVAMVQQGNYLRSWQDKALTQQKRFEQDMAVAAQDPTKWDIEEMMGRLKQYYETGDYLYSAPPIAAQPFDIALQRNQVKGFDTPGTPITETRSGVTGTREVTYGGTEAQGRQRVYDLAMSDPAYTKDLVRQFQSQPASVKTQYLDADKNGTISPDEAKDYNGIVRWAQDTKWQQAIERNVSTTWKPPKVASTESGGFNKKITVSGTNNRNTEYDLQGETPMLVKSFSDKGDTTAPMPDFVPIDVANKVPIFLPITDAYVFDESGNKTLKKLADAQSISLQMMGYSPSMDMLIVKALTDGNGDDAIFKDDVLAIPAEKYDKYLQGNFGIYRKGFQTQKKADDFLYIYPNGQKENKRIKLY